MRPGLAVPIPFAEGLEAKAGGTLTVDRVIMEFA